MADVIPFRPRSGARYEPELTKQQIAAHFGFSTRWVDLRCAEGMPYKPRGGRRRFLLSEVTRWLDQRP